VAYDEVLAERIRAALAGRDGFAEKKMFGGIGFLLRGNMCVGVWKDQLILRLAAERADAALRQEHVRPFDITGRPMTGWVLVDPPGLQRAETLRGWIEEAIAFVSLLPSK
jgi:TfoX/Sxy family transcriptional regulator of competence genes